MKCYGADLKKKLTDFYNSPLAEDHESPSPSFHSFMCRIALFSDENIVKFASYESGKHMKPLH